MKTTQLPEEYAIVLQEVGETGEEDITMLEESLRFDHARLLHILKGLRHKGLILLSSGDYNDTWIRLSAKGRRLMNYLWPDMQVGNLAA
jgi:hypothetical protein